MWGLLCLDRVVALMSKFVHHMFFIPAKVAKLVDALDLGSSG